MRRLVAVFAVLFLLSLALPSCGAFGVVRGSGNLVTRDFALADFSRVQVGYTFKADIRQGTAYSVKVTVDDNLENYLRVSKNGDTLVLNLRNGYSYRDSTFRAVVTMPGLRELRLSGATVTTASGFTAREDLNVNISGASTASFTNIQVKALDANVSGASTLSGDMDASSFANVRLSGASTAELNGKAQNLTAFASGASSLRLGDFAVGDVHFDLSGASNGTVKPSGTISGRVSGASHLSYLGNPTLGDINTSGGSSVSRA